MAKKVKKATRKRTPTRRTRAKAPTPRFILAYLKRGKSYDEGVYDTQTGRMAFGGFAVEASNDDPAYFEGYVLEQLTKRQQAQVSIVRPY